MRLPRFHTVDRVLEAFRVKTAVLRRLPGFVIIGAQKAGTSTLYKNLIRHPQVSGTDLKEVHFFDTNFEKGERWYRSRFQIKTPRSRLSGEASPYYLYHPLAALRLRSLIPNARLIALLRNPVDRAYSHYQHNRRHRREPLSFEEAVDRESERICGERERMLRDPLYLSFSHQHYSYVDRGHYQQQLEVFLRHFERKQLLVLKSERFFQSTEEVWREVLDFLDLDYFPLPERKIFNAGDYPDLDSGIRERLADHFLPFNKRLALTWGEEFVWPEGD